MSGTVRINGIKVHGYHGCLDEEAVIGTQFIVDVTAYLNITAAVENDDLSKTVDYVSVSELVKEEMEKRCKLIETVASRILSRLKKEFPMADSFEVSVTKIAPPSKGLIEDVSVIVEG